MKKEIPKIIHQIWSGIDEPLPDFFNILGNTWKECHPDWKYEYWDNARMNQFIQEFYPQYWEIYNRFPFNVQRWDAIRYLILYQMGGIYVDFDYECLESLDCLLVDKTCCFALEPQSHCDLFKREVMFNNALMTCVPKHPFMNQIVKQVFAEENLLYPKVPKNICVFKTTGPWVLIDLYEKLSQQDKDNIYLIPDKYVTPFDVMQARQLRGGVENEELEACLKDAYAVHYFFGSWLTNEN